MDLIRHNGVLLVSYLQDSFLARYAYNLHRHVFYNTPVFALTMVIPVMLVLQGTVWGRNSTPISAVVAMQLTYALVGALRANIFKQWTCGEDRPYWWVKETTYYNVSKSPRLQQFGNTCLSSPAAPFTTIVSTIISLVLAYHITNFVKKVDFGPKFQEKKRWIVPAVWMTAFVNIFETAIAEVFFASNFPHQVLFAFVLGVVATVIVLRTDFTKPISFKRNVFVNVLLMSITIGTMLKRDVNEFNEFQKKALKWCLRREWLQIDPTPFLDGFVLVGYMIGMVAAVGSRYYKKLNKPKFTWKMILSLLILNLAFTQLVGMATDMVPKVPSTPHVYGWYLCQMFGAAVMPFICASILPYFVQRASGVQPALTKPKTK